MTKRLFLYLICGIISLPLLGQSESSLKLTFQSGISMGRWIYDKGVSETPGGFHQGYDRTHLATYVPIGLQLNYQWKKWSIGLAASISWLGDDELISSTTRAIVPREYFITDGSNIRFNNYMLVLERSLIHRPRYKLRATVYAGTFNSEQDHPREEFFGTHFLWDIGLSNEIYVSDSWFFVVRPIFKSKRISTNESPFKGESHEIISFGIDYGFGFTIF